MACARLAAGLCNALQFPELLVLTCGLSLPELMYSMNRVQVPLLDVVEIIV